MTTFFPGKPPLPSSGGTLTGPLLVPQGTVAAPGLAFAGDSDTGLYSPGANICALVAGGSEKLRVSSTGATVAGHLLPSSSITFTVGNSNLQFRQVWSNSLMQTGAVIASNGTFTDEDPDEIFMDATSGDLTAQVNMASTSLGKRFLFKKTDASANTVTVSLSSGTIDGGASVVLGTQYQWVEFRIVAAGTAYIIGEGQ